MNFVEQLTAWNVRLDEGQIAQYAQFYRLLVQWNEMFNLTAITLEEEVYAKHFADSLRGLPFMHGEVCDVGAGAGFPGLALAIADPNGRYTLIDSVNKKVGFQQAVAEALGLTNIRSMHIRAEDAGRGPMRQTFDTVTARAVAPLPTLLEYLCPLAKVGGHVVVYKTKAEEELRLAGHAIDLLGLTLEQTLDYTIEDANRCLLVFRKTRATPSQYPRGGNKPRTMPL